MEESDDSEEDDCNFDVTKTSLRKAVALLYEEEEVSKEEYFGGWKSVRQCQLPSLQAHNLCAAAEIFTGDNLSRQMLEELRLCFLENNYACSAKLLEWILQRATKPEYPILWRSAVALFLNQDCSDQELLDEFLEMCVDQRIPESKQKLIKLLVSLPDDPKMFALKTKMLSKKEASVTDSMSNVSISVTENEDPDDPEFVFQ